MEQSQRNLPMAGLVWFNVVVGLLMLMMGANFARWGLTRLSGQTFHTHVNWTTEEKNGQEVDYWDLQGYTAWSDMGIFLFGVVIILEAGTIILAESTGNPLVRKFLWFTLLLTLASVVLNLYVIYLLAPGIALISLLAVAFGGYMCFEQWANLKQAR